MLRRLSKSGHAYSDIEISLSRVEPKGACLDLPAGNGVNWQGIKDAGFEPWAADLFPDASGPDGSPRFKVDFTDPLPFSDGAFEAVLCSEGIEHHPAQAGLIEEFARVLVPGGHLLITTPNVLNLIGRLSHMLTGHTPANRGPLCEVTQVWSTKDDSDSFIGHAHMIDYFELRFILKRCGFQIVSISTARFSRSSLFLAPFLWLPAWLATALFLRKRIGESENREIRGELLGTALSPALALGKKMIVMAQKIAE